MSVGNWEKLNKLLTEAMASYNDLIAAMNLVLFEDAMMHICRYCQKGKPSHLQYVVLYGIHYLLC